MTVEVVESYGVGIRRPYSAVVRVGGVYASHTGFVSTKARAMQLGRALAAELFCDKCDCTDPTTAQAVALSCDCGCHRRPRKMKA